MHPIPRLADLDGNLLFLSVSDSLVDHIDSFRLVANGYIVYEAAADEMSYQSLNDEQSRACWPTSLAADEGPSGWVRFSQRGGPAHAVDFSSTPERRSVVDRVAHLRL